MGTARRRLILAALLLATTPAAGQNERDAAQARRESVARELDAATDARAAAQSRAAVLAKDLDRLREELKRAARAMREKRAAAAAAQAEAAAAEAAAAEAEAAIDRRRRELAGLLGAMARLTLRPPEALAALQEGPTEAARASLAFRTLMPEIRRRIETAQGAFAAAAALQDKAAARLADARAAAAALEAERRALDKAVAEKRRLVRRAEAKDEALSVQVDQLAREAKSLDAFFAALAAREKAVQAARKAELQRQASLAAAREREAAAARAEAARRRVDAARAPDAAAPEADPPRADTASEPETAPEPETSTVALGPPIRLAGLGGRQGQGTAPVSGRLAAGFGKGEGVQSRGWVYAAPPSAEVFAPYDGRVAYAGTFRGYGVVVLLDHGAGYHTLLTGLGRMDVAVGDWVLQGEPVGALPDGPAGGEIAAGGSGPGGAKLYVELRKDGEPVDPARWFAQPT